MLENEKTLSEHTCCLCLTDDESSFNSNTVMKSLPLHEMVNYCIGVQLNTNQQEPTLSTICNECVLNVNNFYTFKKKILQAQAVLSELRGETNEDENENAQSGGDNDDDDFLQVIEMRDNSEGELQVVDDDLNEELDEVVNDIPATQENDADSPCYEQSNENDDIVEEHETEILMTNKQHKRAIAETSTSETNRIRNARKKQKADVNAAVADKVTIQLNECLICPAILGDILQLNEHVRSHGEVQCKACHRNFARYSNLKRHFNMVHSKPKPFICEFCGMGFSFAYNLQTHGDLHAAGKIKIKYDVDPFW